MKISATIISRNDNYGGNLNERATYAINSAIDTYDEVFYIDWNSPEHSLLYDIEDNINFKGNLNHIVIDPETASALTDHNKNAQKCCEVLSRNIGLRRSTGDWLLSTNIDIIHPDRNKLEKVIKELDSDTFYTLGRRSVTWEQIKKFHNGEIPFNEWKSLREHFNSISKPSYHLVDVLSKVTTNDNFSLIACCGDYQIASRHIWEEIKGFEEVLVYPGYADTNVMKKSIMHGFKTKAIFDPPIYHIDHGQGAGGFAIKDKFGQQNPQYGDHYRAIVHQDKTENSSTWGFSDIEIGIEIL